MITEKLPRGSRVMYHRPFTREAGFLYFEIEPWSQADRVWLRIPSRCTLRAIRYWLNRLADWHDTGIVTHLEGC